MQKLNIVANTHQKAFFFLFALLLAFNVLGRSKDGLNFRFHYLQIEDGLPQNTINAIAKDQFGFMWFGTNNGICRYDGYSFETFKADEKQANSLPDNMVSAIEPGNDGKLWIGSSNGLSYFDPNSDRIFNYSTPESGCTEIVKVTAIVAQNNRLWVGTANHGLFLLTLTTDKKFQITTHFSVENNNLGNNQVNVVYLGKSGQVYIGTTNEVLMYQETAGQFVNASQFALLPNAYINDIFESSTGDFYLSTANGFFLFRKNSTLPVWYFSIQGNKSSLAHNTVNKIVEDARGNILVATLGGLQQFQPATGNFLLFPEEGPDNFKLNNKFVNTLFCDNTGNVWIGTEKGGINKFNIFQNRFEFYANDPNDKNSLNENTINSILKEREVLWIGTAGGGLNKVELQTGKFTHYTFNANNTTTISSDYVTSLVRASDGKLWAGTWGGGLCCFSTNGNTIIQRITTLTPGYTNQLVDYFVSSLVNDPRGYLLIGTEGGLSMLNLANHQFTNLLAPANFTVPLSEIGCLLLDSKGFYWIGTRNGLFRFSSKAILDNHSQTIVLDQLQLFVNNPANAKSLPGNYVISLMEDSDGNIWAGTYGKGLAQLTVTADGGLLCKNFSQNDGLSNNVIYGIQEDTNGNLWISTDFGLSVMNRANSHFRNFFKQDGLLNNQFYWSASHKSADGELYFGGTEGLNYFKPENIFEYKHIVSPKITRFKIFNQEVKAGEEYHHQIAIRKPIYASDTIRLTYRDNNISFDFSAFDYNLPEKSSFAYMIQQIDKEWVTVPAQRRFATYSNLSGGTYTFLLKASNCDGVWNQTPTKITIIVTPPFWKTQWFRILIVVLVLLTTFLLVQLQMRRIIEQKKILEEKVRLRTQKIEDQKIELEHKNTEISKQRDEMIVLNNKVKEINLQQMRFFTNISHEFRTPLTLILSPLERLISKSENDDETSSILKIVNRNAQRLLALINQLLEIRKIETGNQELQVELTDIKPFLLEIFHAFSELATNHSIDYNYKIDVINSAWVDKEKLENVLYNLLSNAFKFTPKGKQITLKATSIKHDGHDYLQISVEDSGTGVAADQLDKLFDRFYQVTESRHHKNAGTGIGLSLVKSLVEIMYGKVSVKSEPSLGSEFTIEIPVNKHFFATHEIDTTGQVFESGIKNKVAILTDQMTLHVPVTKTEPSIEIEKILVVEDNHDMRSFICTTLSKYYTVIEAENGKEGYELAKEESPTLIISDVMMPVMNGLELCKKIKNNLYTSHIPLILLTAKGNAEDFIEGLEQGADDYVAKPFNIDILVAKVNAIIENRKKVRNKFSALEDVQPSELTISALDEQFLNRVNAVVEKYFSDPTFDVDLFASELFVSRSQLYKKLKVITDLSANDYINVYRLKKSVELIKQGTMQISEIAYSIGFNDPKYFSRIFKKYYKCSPSEYLSRKNTT